MSSKELQQPEGNLSSEANRHLSAAAKTQETIAAGSRGSVREKLGQILNAFGQKSLATAAVAAIIACGIGKGNQEPTFTETPPPTPVVRQLEEGMPSQNIQLEPTAEAPASTPVLEQQAPTPELSPRETVVQLKKEVQAESSKIMDNMEKDAQEIGYFFINIGGEKTPEGEDHRAFLLPIPIKDYFSVGSNDRNRYVVITSEGLKTFSPTPLQKQPTENIYDEQVIRDFFIPYLEYFQGRLIESINVAADLGTTPKDPFHFALSKETETPRFPFSQGIVFSPHDIITYTDFEGEKTEGITTLYIPPINDKVKEVMEESKEMTKELTHSRIDKYRRRLEDTKDLSNTLQSPLQPSPQTPSSPPQPIP